MATRNGPDLSFAQTTFRRFLDDTCKITRDAGAPNNTFDDVLDLSTGALTEVTPGAGIVVIYNGACKFSPVLTSEPRYALEGEGQEVKRNYTLGLPKEARPALVRVGDEVTITTSRRDPMSVGQVFYIKEFIVNSWAIQRKFIMELREVIT